jgi:hypothetical protein
VLDGQRLVRAARAAERTICVLPPCRTTDGKRMGVSCSGETLHNASAPSYSSRCCRMPPAPPALLAVLQARCAALLPDAQRQTLQLNPSAVLYLWR